MLQQRTQMVVIYLLAFLFCMLTALAIILMQPFMFRNVTFEGLAALFILDGLALTAGFLVVLLISVMIVKLTEPSIMKRSASALAVQQNRITLRGSFTLSNLIVRSSKQRVDSLQQRIRVSKAYQELEMQFPNGGSVVSEDDELKEIIFENFMREDPIMKEIENYAEQTKNDAIFDPTF